MADFFAKGKNPINGYGGGNLASKSDLTDIFQTGSTATQAISAGTYFYLDGTLVRAIADIANGATFTLNTNYKVVTAGGLNEIARKVSTKQIGTVNASGTMTINLSTVFPTNRYPCLFMIAGYRVGRGNLGMVYARASNNMFLVANYGSTLTFSVNSPNVVVTNDDTAYNNYIEVDKIEFGES